MRISIILMVVASFTISLSANTSTSLKPNTSLILNTKVRGERGEIRKVLQTISVKYGIKFGYITNNLEPISVSFGKGTLRQAINSLVKKLGRYTWKFEAGIILLSPRETVIPEQEQVLMSKISSLFFKKEDGLDTLRFTLYKDKQFSQTLTQLNLNLQLVYRLVSVSHFNSTGIGVDIDFLFNDAKLIDILNQLIKSSTSHVWEVKINFGKVYIDIY